MTDDRQGKEFYLAFFSMERTPDGEGRIGGVLVTDSRGTPQEFECTHPVRPTTVQEALYGQKLDSYVSATLCGKPLLSSLKIAASVCIVASSDLLEVRELVNLPVVYVSRLGDTLTASSPPSSLEHETGRFDPIAVTTHQGFESDFQAVQQTLRSAFRYLDLIEPFERIKTAVHILAERDQRFR
jgi:hypothetical protein